MGLFSKRKAAQAAATHTVGPGESAGPTYEPLTTGEVQWMSQHLDLAAKWGIDLSDIRQIESLYETLRQTSSQDEDDNLKINLLGSVFGQHLANSTSLKWVVSTDAFGTELALHDASIDLLVYPANLIAKRWSSETSGDFMSAIADGVHAALARR